MKRIYLENLNMFNDPEYKNLFIDSSKSEKEAIEKKARYLKGQDAKPRTLTIEELAEMTNDDEVTISGLFKREAEIILAHQPMLFDVWEKANIDVAPIVNLAFKNFDTLRNSETYPMDDMCHQILVSECVHMYFEECLCSAINKKQL